MNVQKVKLIIVNQYPIEKPYIKVNDFFIDFKEDGRISQCHQNHFDKKILKNWQPIKFAIVYPDDEDQIILTHEEIFNSKFRCEMLDEVLTEDGRISTKIKETSFDISLCDLILSNDQSSCWLTEDKVILLQENQQQVSRSKLNLVKY